MACASVLTPEDPQRQGANDPRTGASLISSSWASTRRKDQRPQANDSVEEKSTTSMDCGKRLDPALRARHIYIPSRSRLCRAHLSRSRRSRSHPTRLSTLAHVPLAHRKHAGLYFCALSSVCRLVTRSIVIVWGPRYCLSPGLSDTVSQGKWSYCADGQKSRSRALLRGARGYALRARSRGPLRARPFLSGTRSCIS